MAGLGLAAADHHGGGCDKLDWNTSTRSLSPADALRQRQTRAGRRQAARGQRGVAGVEMVVFLPTVRDRPGQRAGRAGTSAEPGPAYFVKNAGFILWIGRA